MQTRNAEGYIDPTAGAAVDTVSKEEREVMQRITELMEHLRWVADKCDFAIVNRVHLRDTKTGKKYR